MRDVLVWTKGPFLFRNERVVADSLDGQRRAEPNDIKRLDEPIVVRVKAGAAAVEVAAQSDDAELLLGPYDLLSGDGYLKRDPQPKLAPAA